MLDGFPKNDLRFLAKMRKEIPARKTGFPVPGQALIRANGHPHYAHSLCAVSIRLCWFWPPDSATALSAIIIAWL